MERLDSIIERHHAVLSGHASRRTKVVKDILQADVRLVVLYQSQLRRERNSRWEMELEVSSPRLFSLLQDTAC